MGQVAAAHRLGSEHREPRNGTKRGICLGRNGVSVRDEASLFTFQRYPSMGQEGERGSRLIYPNQTDVSDQTYAPLRSLGQL